MNEKDSLNSLSGSNGLNRAAGALLSNPSTPLPTRREQPSPAWSPLHFPAILMDASGRIVLCPQCASSNISKQPGSLPACKPASCLYVCNGCGAVWRSSC